MNNIHKLRDKYKWPDVKPDVPRRYKKDNTPEGWCAKPNVEMFKSLVNENTKIIIDAGSWLGLSAWHFLRLAPNATVICLDTWRGSEEHKNRDVLPVLYETFLVNMWDYKDRIIPMRRMGQDGFFELSRDISPDVVYIDMAHDKESVIRDISNALGCFPNAKICGDDYTWQGVKDALEFFTSNNKINFETFETCWKVK